MKILYTTDLHGVKRKFLKMVELSKNSDVLIFGADILPPTDMENFIIDFLPGIFKKIKIPTIIDFGNDDFLCFYDKFIKVVNNFENIFISHKKEVVYNDISFIGLNYVPDYPFRIKDWCRRDNAHLLNLLKQYGNPFTTDEHNVVGKSKIVQIGTLNVYEIDDLKSYYMHKPSITDELNILPKPLNEKVIYLFHSPPNKIFLDRTSGNEHVGSGSIYDFIKERQPILTLHGHIHENFYYTDRYFNNIKQTLCVQPGQRGSFNHLVYCEIETNNLQNPYDSIKRYEIEF